VKALISVIVPIYNVEQYLEQCLDSLISQNMIDFEIIGVNDSSQDNSASIFENYMRVDNRFKLINHDENRGLPSARNTGISKASGDYLFFLDSDDWIAPHTFSILYEIAKKDDVEISMGGLLKCEDKDGTASPKNHAKYMKEELHNETIFDNPVIGTCVVSVNKLIKTNFIINNKLIFSPEPRRFEDMLTYKWYLSNARVSTTNDITYFYRQRYDSPNVPSITQEMNIDVMSDKLLAIADITEFIIKKGYFNTRYDPINNKDGLTCLPKALSWILPAICRYCCGDQINKKEIKNAFSSFKKLCILFPKNYISNLKKKELKAYRYITNYELEIAIKKIVDLYDFNLKRSD
jgi:glycosyltransferase involved in cell wall biosynthesis